MGKLIRPGDPVVVQKSAWSAYFSVRKTKLVLWSIGVQYKTRKRICRLIGHPKTGGIETVIQGISSGDDQKVTICQRCGTYL